MLEENTGASTKTHAQKTKEISNQCPGTRLHDLPHTLSKQKFAKPLMRVLETMYS